MKRTTIILLVLAMALAAMPAMAARMATLPLIHDPIQVFQAYPGDSNGTNLAQMGYKGLGGDVISSVPGILSIVPGANWANFVAAAQAGVPYTIKNVVLIKRTPKITQCADVFPPKVVTQQGTPNIRLWWPLMYEVPSTTWTLTITYGTPTAWADPANPGAPSYVHVEQWQWHVDASLQSMKYLLELFHELPFGLDEVPLVSNETLYPKLQAMLDAVIASLAAGDTVNAGLTLSEFELEVSDACITVSPATPAPVVGTGIANTPENPACCKLMADAEYVGFKYGIFQPKK